MNPLAVCSWSLQPTRPENLAAKVRICAVDSVQLALEHFRTGEWSIDDARLAFRAAGVHVVSGMMTMAGEDYSTIERIRVTGGVAPDETWEANLAAARENAWIALEFGLPLVTFHAGFVPESREDPRRRVMVDRLAALSRVFAEAGVAIALETGQESAGELAALLGDLGAAGVGVGVNFDPANMLLYGAGDPVAALERLAPWVQQIHIKDATPPAAAGAWGEERVVGEGAVDWPAFLRVVRERLPLVRLVVEREAGESRIEDICTAVRMLKRETAAERAS